MKRLLTGNRQDRNLRAWTESDIPVQVGKTVVITGANSGIGFQVATVLAQKGAKVVLACRNDIKARNARAAILKKSEHRADVDIVEIDTSDSRSIRAGSKKLMEQVGQIDVLVNNAGVAMPPYAVTQEGFELQFATNYFGHFVLTGLLLPRLLEAPAGRIVSISSLAHRFGHLDLGDLSCARRYRPFSAYAQSKLAILLFTYELQRRLAVAGANAKALAAHPGGSRTNLLTRPRGPTAGGNGTALLGRLMQFQDADIGALPILRAITDLTAPGGTYFGPSGPFELKGFPAPAFSSRRSRDADLQGALWRESEQAAGFVYPI